MSSFDIGHSINNISDYVYGMPIIKTIITNPLLVSLIIVTIIILALKGIYKEATKTVSTKTNIKAFIYLFGFTSLMLIFHYYAVRKYSEVEISKNTYNDVFNQVQNATTYGGASDVVNVSPIIMGTDKFVDPFSI